jgi:aryl-alcohol dehydrogenase-like predicted oxidoreductase
MATEKGITPAQLALAWILHQGDFIVPIPGARKIRHLEENAAAVAVTLSSEDASAIERSMPKDAISGGRYTANALALVDG